MPKAVKVNGESINDIVEWGATKGLQLGYLRDNYEFYAEDGEELWIVLDGDQWKKNVTVTDMIASDFFKIWRITDGEMDNHFNEIERIKED